MLTNERYNPRPRPPAHIRRSSSKGGFLSSDGAPPPPYDSSLQEFMEDNASDPIATTAKIMGIDFNTTLDVPPITEEDVSNKSKAEITGLFLQAERIIKEREQELNVAANLGKALLETNEALKLRHDALLSRLPAMQSSAASASSVKFSRADASAIDDDLPSSSGTFSRTHSRANSIASNTQDSPARSRSSSIIAPSPRRGHGRRISASPSMLHMLSETNAELIAELTRLHDATDTAQLEGAQRLRKLEREIGGLKAELEATQRTNAELEEKVKEKADVERKRERDERLRRLKTGGDDQEGDSTDESEIRDFAPQGSGAAKWNSVPVTPRIKRSASPSFAEPDSEQSDAEAQSASGSSIRSSNPASPDGANRRGEYAVVAQLYRKVLELQEANAELSERNRVTTMQLTRAEREARSIKSLYDAIGEEFAADQSGDPSTDTVRASSRGPSRVCSRSNSWSFRKHGDPFLEDNRGIKEGSYRSLGSRVLHQGGRVNKNRPPLTDSLFSPPASTSRNNTKDKTPPSVILFPPSPLTKPRLKPKLKAKAEPQGNSAPLLSPASSLVLRRRFSGASGGSSISSRTSTASSFRNSSFVRSRNRGRRSLGSELGSEFGDDWADTTSRHSSLFDDGSIRALSDAETEPGAYADAEDEDPALAALHDALTSPLTGRLLERDEHILPVGSLQSSPGDAFHLVAHAVAARPTRWLESDSLRVREAGPRAGFTYMPTGEDPWETTRYPEIEPGAETDIERASVRMRRRERAIGRMVSTAHSRRASSALVPSASRSQDVGDNSRPGFVESIKRTSANVLIELWIFLQFVVVVCTFLYTMSRRGPREVLGAPPRRA